MKVNGLYKHDNNTDVAMMPLEINYVKPVNGYRVKLRWFNIVNKNHTFDMGCPDQVFIKQQDFHKWKEVDV